MTDKRIRNNLRLFRREKGLSQKQVAAILGLESSSVVSRWERGTRLPDTMNALKLATLYRSAVDVIYQDLRLRLADDITGREESLSDRWSCND